MTSNYYINQANKNRTRNSGENIIDIIQAHLNSKGYNFLRDQILYNGKFTTNNNKRLPDLILGTYKKLFVGLILEIDGNGSGNNVHGIDMEGATESTKERNKDFLRARDFNYITLHMEEMADNGLSLKKDKEAFLGAITYMVSHELNKIILRSQL